MARLQNNISAGNYDRVAEAILEYAAEEAKLKIFSPLQTSREDTDLKLDHYTNMYSAFRKSAVGPEKQSIKYIRYEIARLKAKLNPTFFNRVYYSEITDAIRAAFRGTNDPVRFF